MILPSLSFFLVIFSHCSQLVSAQRAGSPSSSSSFSTSSTTSTTRRGQDPWPTAPPGWEPPPSSPPNRPQSPWRLNRTRESSEIHNFLKLFGWLRPHSTLRDDEVPAAIRKIQKVLHEPQTGVYDDGIENLMARPHCGTDPPFNEGDANANLTKRYTIWGPKWDHNALTYRFINYTDDLPAERQRTLISNAFAVWSSYIPITYSEAAPSVDVPDIHIKFVSMGRSETAYAATSMLAYGTDLASGLINITFNDDYNWADDRLFNYTALHEIGHTLGLSHSKVQNAIMWPFYDGTIRPMYSDDLMAVHTLYGWKNPRWNRIDANPATRSLVSVSSPGAPYAPLDGIYQLRSNGQVLYFSASQGTWITVDNNPVTVQIAGAGGNLYQRHTDGSIYRYSGSGGNWQYIGTSDSAIIDIIAAADQIYQRRKDGWVARWSGSGTTWTSIAQPTASRMIAISDRKVIWNLQASGDIVRVEWPYTNGWATVGHDTNTVAIAVGGEEFYKLQYTGQILWLDLQNAVWRIIDDSGAQYIFARGVFLYSQRQDGGIWRYTGTPMIWEQLDWTGVSAYVIGDSKGAVWELLKSGEVLTLVS